MDTLNELADLFDGFAASGDRAREATMAAVTYDAGQRKRAKLDGVPLVAFDFDDRHVPRERGGGFGRMTVHTPADLAAAKKLRDFVVGMIEARELLGRRPKRG